MRARRAGFARGPTDPRRGCAFFGAALINGNSRDDLVRRIQIRSESLDFQTLLLQPASYVSCERHGLRTQRKFCGEAVGRRLIRFIQPVADSRLQLSRTNERKTTS